jgi:isopentenyl-diphosphate delta-isomerase
VRDELGVPATNLVPCGSFVYEARDPVSGLLESEFDHVFVGAVTNDLAPNPAEIEEVRFLDLEDAFALLRGASAAPWASTVLELAAGRSEEL